MGVIKQTNNMLVHTALRVELLGSPRVYWQQEQLTFSSDKSRAMVYYLTAEACAVKRETLVDYLWLNGKLVNLRQELSKLRKLPGADSWLQAQPNVCIQCSTDIKQLEESIQHEDYATALSIWRKHRETSKQNDHFLHGFDARDFPETFNNWLEEKRTYCNNLYQSALQCRALELEQQGNPEVALRLNRELLTQDPLNETAHQAVMRLEVSQGNYQAALNQFERCRQALSKEMNIKPLESTLHLFRQVKKLAETQKTQITLSLKALPVTDTPFMGRQKELTDIRNILHNPACRMLTLTGTGGIGKTRLALKIAHDDARNYPDGVYFISLISLHTRQQIISAIAQATHLNHKDDAERQLLNHLKPKQLLLIIDNAEHLNQHADLFTNIIKTSQLSKLLITSRTHLNTAGEWLYQVEGLTQPPSINSNNFNYYDATRFFLHCAQRIKPNFTITQHNKQAIHQICQHVAGMPLALELAATWLRVLPAASIARELQASTVLLTKEHRGRPERHQSINAVFDYSWQLLTPEQQQALCDLSVFPDGFTLEAAKNVTGISLLTLRELCETSLLNTTEERYTQHPLFKQYCQHKAAQHPEQYQKIRAQFCHYYSQFLSTHDTSKNPQAFNRIKADLINIREAFTLAVTQCNLSVILTIQPPLMRYFTSQSLFQEAQDVLNNAIQQTKTNPNHNQQNQEIKGQLYLQYGSFCHRLGRYQDARHYLQQGLNNLTHLNTPHTLAHAQFSLGDVEYSLGNYAAANKNYQASLNAYQQLNKLEGIATCLYRQGIVANKTGDFTQAKHLFHESLRVHKSIHNTSGQALALYGTGIISVALGDYQTAKQNFQTSLSLYQSIGNKSGIGLAHYSLGYTAYSQKNYEQALRHHQTSLNIYKTIGEQDEVIFAYLHLAMTHLALNNLPNVNHYLQQAETLIITIGSNAATPLLDKLKGDAAYQQQNLTTAHHHYLNAIHKAKQLNTLPELLASMLGLANTYTAQNQPQYAIKLLTVINTHPAARHLEKQTAQQHLKQLQKTMSAHDWHDATNHTLSITTITQHITPKNP